MAIDLTGITNENEFYTHHYLAAILEGDLKPLFEAWSKQEVRHGMACGLARPFQAMPERGIRPRGTRGAADEKWFGDLFTVLGYSFTPEIIELDGHISLPLAGQITRANGQPELWVMAAPRQPTRTAPRRA